MTTTALTEQADNFASRSGKNSIGILEFFTFIRNIIEKIKEVLTGTSISLIYRPDVPDLDSFPANPQKGWACRVMDQLDEHGRPCIFQFDGTDWNQTPFTAFINEVMTVKERSTETIPLSDFHEILENNGSWWSDIAAELNHKPAELPAGIYRIISFGNKDSAIASTSGTRGTAIAVKNGEVYSIFYDSNNKLKATLLSPSHVDPQIGFDYEYPDNGSYVAVEKGGTTKHFGDVRDKTFFHLLFTRGFTFRREGATNRFVACGIPRRLIDIGSEWQICGSATMNFIQPKISATALLSMNDGQDVDKVFLRAQFNPGAIPLSIVPENGYIIAEIQVLNIAVSQI